MEVAEPEQEQLGRYRIERTLGAGGMGVVYLAEDTRLRRQVAIKKLRKDSTSESASARIHSEAQLLAQLNHSNIVQLYDVLEEDGGIALVMEYVEGTTLREWMREHTAPLREKLGLLMQICKGLTEAHSLGIVHRDLKPDNILITFNGTAKITDFGIAKSLDHEATDITREDQVAGTVDAMSPEQLQGLPLCARSDLFSLGTIAYELLCGAKPFDKGEGGSMALAQKVVNEPHIPPQQAWERLPEPLAVLLDKLLAKQPHRRPESAQQVYEALAFLYQQGSDTDTQQFSETVTQLLRKPPNRHKRLLSTIAGLVIAIGAGYWGWQEITRLEPQYIAVMPVEISGEVRGEDNAKALTATMVRQALMNAASQLKASALVSFSPKEGEDFDAQLKALREKGVTDALYARLDCARVRCEIELQRIGPANSQIKQQADFAFLADNRQESEYRISNRTVDFFPAAYQKSSSAGSAMSDEHYKQYLNVASRIESRDVTESDLSDLERLVAIYPQNLNLYRTHADITTFLFLEDGKTEHLNSALTLIDRGKSQIPDSSSLLETELLIRSFDTDMEAFNRTFSQLEEQELPTSNLLGQYSRFLFGQGDYESGLRYAQDAAALNPSADNLYLIAINQTASGDYSTARTLLERLTQNYPQHWSSYSLLGVIELESGNLTEAEAAITAIPVELRSWRTKSNLGVVYFLQGKYKQALATYEQVLEKVPDNIPAIEQLAEAYSMLGEKKLAESNFKKVLSLSNEKQDLRTRQYRSLALINMGNATEAIPLIKELLRESPEDTYIQYTAAQVYALSEEWRSASYHIEILLNQGMSTEWFNLPAFQKLCTQPQASVEVKIAICD